LVGWLVITRSWLTCLLTVTDATSIHLIATRTEVEPRTGRS